MHIILLRLLAFLKKKKIILKFISFCMNKLGFKRYFDKLEYRINQQKLTNIDSLELDNKLLRYYTSTPLVEKIYDRITKRKL